MLGGREGAGLIACSIGPRRVTGIIAPPPSPVKGDDRATEERQLSSVSGCSNETPLRELWELLLLFLSFSPRSGVSFGTSLSLSLTGVVVVVGTDGVTLSLSDDTCPETSSRKSLLRVSLHYGNVSRGKRSIFDFFLFSLPFFPTQQFRLHVNLHSQETLRGYDLLEACC